MKEARSHHLLLANAVVVGVADHQEHRRSDGQRRPYAKRSRHMRHQHKQYEEDGCDRNLARHAAAGCEAVDVVGQNVQVDEADWERAVYEAAELALADAYEVARNGDDQPPSKKSTAKSWACLRETLELMWTATVVLSGYLYFRHIKN